MNQPKTRTDQQNKALHLWFKLKSDQVREAGFTAQMVWARSIELEMTPEILKTIYKEVMKKMHGKSSTTQLLKGSGEIEEIAEHLNRFFAEEPFFLEGLPIPSRDKEEFISTLEKIRDKPYPESKGDVTAF